jgi:hypothetical protein
VLHVVPVALFEVDNLAVAIVIFLLLFFARLVVVGAPNLPSLLLLFVLVRTRENLRELERNSTELILFFSFFY